MKWKLPKMPKISRRTGRKIAKGVVKTAVAVAYIVQADLTRRNK